MKHIIALIELEGRFKSESARLQAEFEQQKAKLIEKSQEKIDQFNDILKRKDEIIQEEVARRIDEIQQQSAEKKNDVLNFDTKKIEQLILEQVD